MKIKVQPKNKSKQVAQTTTGNPHAAEGARPHCSTRDANSSWARRSVQPLLSLLLLVAVQMGSSEEAPVAVDGRSLPLLPWTSTLESQWTPSTASTSHTLASAHHGASSGGGSSVLAATVSGHVRASSSSEEGHFSLPKTSTSGSVAVAAHRKGSSSARRPSGRRLTQALDSSYFNGLQIAKLLASDGAAEDLFGTSVAIDGDTMVIGAPEGNNNNGTAYIYTRDIAGSLTASWTQRAKLQRPDFQQLRHENNDRFGCSVAISGDTIAVGAEPRNDWWGSGSTYIFTRDVSGNLTASWTQRAKLQGGRQTSFGTSVALSGDTVVVGTSYIGTRSGQAIVFTRDVAGNLTASWTERARLRSPGNSNDVFGYSVAISGDTVAVSAMFDDENGDSSGSVYIFTRDVAGNLTAGWTQRDKLMASESGFNDVFGSSVSISGDTVAVGARNDDDQSDRYSDSSGSAYIFTRNVAGILTAGWTQRAKLLASDERTSGDRFGFSISLSGDTVAVGTRITSRTGRAYIFTRDITGSLTASWTQRAKLFASDGAAGDGFGSSVALSGDTVAVGAFFFSVYGGGSSSSSNGSVYIFASSPPPPPPHSPPPPPPLPPPSPPSSPVPPLSPSPPILLPFPPPPPAIVTAVDEALTSASLTISIDVVIMRTIATAFCIIFMFI
eukprot:CAMPEP_0198703712 /NCGR_PEP_ID=MMETSP1468-20131203/389501_1 /TAXON_ID=1461545 /ORGANISM="Mantoniella sp, Strain CCMP1436" /LENGTH=668 /DNA_ID=CAMNT_0044462447 /DNA_START=2249 /DNA_END=4255 /DNA_ORIENTATION=+